MRRILLILTFLCMVGSLFADEATLTITQKLSTTRGAASTTVGPLTFNFTGSKTSYQSNYEKIVPGSGLTVSIANGTISKIVIGYYGDRTKTISFTANPGTWTQKTLTWTGSASSVTFTASDNGECSISSITVTYSSTTSLNFSSSDQSVELTKLGVNPLKPTNASGTVTYTSSNTNVAKVNDNNNWLRFVNTGKVTIVATDANGATGSYTLTITAPDATTSISSDGKTYSVTGTGKLNDKDVEDIPYISMMVGADGEAAVVREVKSGYFAISGIDVNGYSHTYSPNGVPTQGTFYTFKPTVSGSLTITGAFDTNGSSTTSPAYLYEGSNSTNKGSIAYVKDYAEATGKFDVTAGKTYYLYVPNSDATGWDYFCLHSFTFNPSFYFETKKVVATSGTYTQGVKGGNSNTIYSAKALNSSELSNVSVTSAGEVTWSGNGGAILVTATDNGVCDSYVITVPYATHTWDLSTTDLDKMKANTTDWALNYKVRQYDSNKTLTYINVPVVANATPLDGTNALYIPKTSGLLIKAGSKSFGAEVKTWNDNVGFDGLTLDQQLALPYTSAATTSNVTLNEGSTLTIPNLAKGQYVRMKWQRYSPSRGDLVSASNLTDLEGKDITSTFNVGVPAHSSLLGYETFKVKDNNDVSFTLSGEGWVNIYSIEVFSGDWKATDLRLVQKPYDPNANPKYTNPLKYKQSQENPQLVSYDQDPSNCFTPSCMSTGTDANSYVNGTIKYSLAKKEGNVDATITEDGKLTVNSGQGIITIKQQGINSGYVLDQATTDVTIYEQKSTTCNYPYTWDFTKNNTAASSYTGSQWSASDNDVKLKGSDWDYYEGDELRTSGSTAVPETEHLGITIPHQDNALTVALGTGLTFASNDNQSVTIPSVKSGFKTYILAKVSDGGSLACNGTTLSGQSTFDGLQLYTIDGTGADQVISVKNATIERIGVTNTFKNFNHLGDMKYSYATEYRDMAERYDLTELFTNGASPVTAYYVSAVNDKLAMTQKIGVAPANTGVVLVASNDKAPKNVPLFVPDVNSSAETATGNMLKGVNENKYVPATETDGSVNYGFTPYYYDVDESGKAGTTQKTGTLAFYRLLDESTSETVAAHKAYLNVPKSQAAKEYIFLSFIENGEAPTAILLPQAYSGEKDVYYTLTGQRLPQRPVMPGIYVRNGKKILIK